MSEMSEINKSVSRHEPAATVGVRVDGAPMKKLVVAWAASLALTGMAYGADIPVFKAPPPPRPADTWTGFYMGVDGGVARHDAFFNNLDLPVEGQIFTTLVLLNAGTFSTAQTGGFGGGYAGYNWQDRSFVAGLEADINGFLNIKAKEAWLGDLGPNQPTATQSQDVPWVATFRARMGLDFESTLFYFTGGLAVGKVENSFNVACPAGLPASCFGLAGGSVVASFSENTTRLGWTAGAGVEHMLSQHWTIRGEFRYVDLGKETVVCSSVVNGGNCPIGRGTNAVPLASGVQFSGLRGEFSNVLTSAMVGLGYKF